MPGLGVTGFLTRASGSTPPSYTFNGSTSGGTSTSIGSVPFGTAASNRYVVAVIFVTSGGFNLGSVGSVTIGGVAATQLSQATYVAAIVAIFMAAVPTGTSGTVAWSNTGTISATYVSTYSIYGLNSTTPVGTNTATNASATTLSINVTSVSGAVLIAGTDNLSSSSDTLTWTGVTQDFSATPTGSTKVASASGTASGASSTISVQHTQGNIAAASVAMF